MGAGWRDLLGVIFRWRTGSQADAAVEAGGICASVEQRPSIEPGCDLGAVLDPQIDIVPSLQASSIVGSSLAPAAVVGPSLVVMVEVSCQ